MTYVKFTYILQIKKGKRLMGKYVYPAVFTPEEAGKYSVYFPDIDGCYTCGDDLADGMEMAEDALALMLTHLED